jgi:ankyrin repeat protein
MELNIDIEPKELDLKDILGRTTLHIACERGYRSLVERLLERGADVRATTHHGSTPLHIAAASGSLAICELLLNSKGLQSDVHVLDIYGVAPLYYAILHDHLAVYQLLVDRQAFPALQSQPFPPFSKQHLIPAAALGSVKMVEALLNRYNEPNLVDHSSYGKVLPYRHNGWTAMMYATHERKLNVMKLLANSPHIKLDIQDDKGRTALFLAAEEDFVEGVQYLVSLPYPQNQEIGLNLVDRYAYTPLMRAAINGHHEVVKVLLETTGVRYETRYVNCFGSVVDLERLIKDESIMELIREKQRQDAEKQN